MAVLLDSFRTVLEEDTFCLTDRCHMSDLVPFVCVQEQANIKAEILGKPVSVGSERQWQLSDLLMTPLSSVVCKKHDREEIGWKLINTLSD